MQLYKTSSYDWVVYGLTALALCLGGEYLWSQHFSASMPTALPVEMPSVRSALPSIEPTVSRKVHPRSSKSNTKSFDRQTTSPVPAATTARFDLLEHCATEFKQNSVVTAHATELFPLDDAEAVLAELAQPSPRGTLFAFEQHYQIDELVFLARVTWNGATSSGYSVDLMLLKTGELENTSYETLVTQRGLNQFTALRRIEELLAWQQREMQKFEAEILPLVPTRAFSFASVALANIYSDRHLLDDDGDGAFVAEFEHNSLSRFADASFSCSRPEADAQTGKDRDLSENAKYSAPNL